jgi:DNA invertase Pin-like site-specific DNA recombinase
MPDVKIIKGKRGYNANENSVFQDKIRVAAYCRVSTDDEEQLDSYNSQVRHYTDLIKSKPEWDFVEVYADEAITGTMIDKRDNFKKMINDAISGKLDVILTKSISRFARNTLDVLKYVRLLREHRVAIRFEEEKIDTSTMDGELLLSVLSAVYQQEVENISANVKKGLRMKMQRGELVGFQGCLGYDYYTDTKEIAVNEEEAKTVRFIFKQYLKGYGCTSIARQLEEQGIKTKQGSNRWTNGGIMGILKNEKYKGDLLLGKTYTVNPISKKRLRNFGEEDRFFIHQHHEPIISAIEYEKAQEIRTNRNKGKIGGAFSPGIHVRVSQRFTFSCMLECGFCGKVLARRIWHSTTAHQKIMWHCVSATKNGKKVCPHSKAVAEEAIENAFVQSFQMTIQQNKGTVEELLERLKESIEKNALADTTGELQRKINRLNSKINKLLDLRLDGGIEKETYEEKYRSLSRELEKLKSENEKNDLQSSRQKDVQKRLDTFRSVLKSNVSMKNFDPDVFNSIVEKVVVGGFDEDGEPDPTKLTFIYRTNVTDERSADDFKPPRRPRGKKNNNLTEENSSISMSDTDYVEMEPLAASKDCLSSSSELAETASIEDDRHTLSAYV